MLFTISDSPVNPSYFNNAFKVTTKACLKSRYYYNKQRDLQAINHRNKQMNNRKPAD